MDFIDKYFISPILMRESYNIYNTIVYAIIAIVALYLLSQYFQRRGIKMLDNDMFNSAIPYAITGGVIRAIVDLVDSGKRADGIYSLYQYSFWNVTPGIYLVMASLFIFIYYLELRYNLKKLTSVIGYSLLAFHVFLVLPNIHNLAGFLAIVMAYIPAVLLSNTGLQFYAYFGQGLDGGSTFIGIELVGKYAEKHVLSGLIGDNLSYLVFYVLKLALVFVIDRYYQRVGLNDDDRRIILSIAAILGLGVGTRNMLRIVMDV
ncbi:MAG: DUF63 family protein [Candidatus Anstonellales archaeon]